MDEHLSHAEALAEIRRLRSMNAHLIGRVAAAAEVLCKISNRTKLTCPTCGTIYTPEHEYAACVESEQH